MAAFVWVFFHRPNKENSMVHLFFHLSQSNKHSFQKQDFLEFLISPLNLYFHFPTPLSFSAFPTVFLVPPKSADKIQFYQLFEELLLLYSNLKFPCLNNGILLLVFQPKLPLSFDH